MERTDTCVDLKLGVEVSDWIRNTVMLTGMVVWAAYVVVTLARGGDVEAIVWGFPGAVYFSMNPSFKKKGGNDGQG